MSQLAAVRFAKCVCLPLTYRNLHVIQLAIEAESNYSQVTIAKAAAIIMEGALTALEMGECVNYFWFEDCCWRRRKMSFKEQDEMRQTRKARWY